MNQDQVKGILLSLENSVEEFTVLFSGKKSKKVDGLYKPEIREIIIHNKNFPDDNSLIYTAIHEFAHHIHLTGSHGIVSARAHTGKFWEIFHRLLYLAEEKGIYDNIFKKDTRFVELTKKIREKYLDVDAQLMKELGALLLEVFNLCVERHASFDDYVDRELKLHRRAARTIVNIHTKDINPDIGYENMKIVARLSDSDEMRMAEEAFLKGDSPDMVVQEYISKKVPEDVLDSLLDEKSRTEQSIERLKRKLAGIEEKIKKYS
jgi:hypothetical protein